MTPFLFGMNVFILYNVLSHYHASYTPPRSSEEALMIADENIEYRSATKDGTLNMETPYS
jgi:hypothetical protein